GREGRRAMRLLLLAAVFPPKGGPGAIRYAHLTHYWARAGHVVDVVTSSVGWHDDSRLSELLDVQGLNVFRVEGPNVGAWVGAGVGASLGAGVGSRVGAGLGARVGGFLGTTLGSRLVPSLIEQLGRVGSLRDWLKDPSANVGALRAVARGVKSVRDQVVIPDEQLVYVAGWVSELERLLKEEHYDALLTTSYPYSAHLAGAAVKMRHPDLRWVMELRDPWAGTRVRGRTAGPAASVDAALERFCVERADTVSVISDDMRELYRERYPDATLVVTPNGFEPGPPLAEPPTPPPYVFCYTGSFDHEVSPAAPVIEMLDHLLSQGVALEFKWAGTADLPSAEVLAQFDKRHPGVLEKLGQLPFSEVHTVREDSHFLVLTLTPGAPVYTTKVFEYLDSGRPVVALVGEGELRKLLDLLPHVVCEAPQSAATLDALLRRSARPPEFLDAHRYSSLAAELVSVLSTA
ncbi:MAG: glycosyltransferase, partial [Myxococcota bacterium]